MTRTNIGKDVSLNVSHSHFLILNAKVQISCISQFSCQPKSADCVSVLLPVHMCIRRLQGGDPLFQCWRDPSTLAKPRWRQNGSTRDEPGVRQPPCTPSAKTLKFPLRMRGDDSILFSLLLVSLPSSPSLCWFEVKYLAVSVVTDWHWGVVLIRYLLILAYCFVLFQASVS